MAGLRGVIVDIAPLRVSPDYRRLWGADLVASAAHEIVAVAVPFQVYVLTGSSLAVGLVGAAELVPLLLGSLAAGAFVDAHDRRRLILIAQVGAAGCAVALALLASAGSPPLVAIYALAAAIAAFASIEAPVRNASIPQLVGAHHLPSALALNQIVGQLTALGGPALAGVLLATLGVTAVYVTAVAGFAVALLAILRVRPMPPAGGGATRSGWAAVREGLAFARSTPVLLSTFVIDLNAMIFGMPRALFPALAVSTYHVGPGGLGLMYAAPGAGALIGAAASGWVGAVRRRGLAVIVSVVSWGAAIVAFGLVPHDRFRSRSSCWPRAGPTSSRPSSKHDPPARHRMRCAAVWRASHRGRHVRPAARRRRGRGGCRRDVGAVRGGLGRAGVHRGVGVLHAVSPVLARYRRDDA
jgi:MFS family permease